MFYVLSNHIGVASFLTTESEYKKIQSAKVIAKSSNELDGVLILLEEYFKTKEYLKTTNEYNEKFYIRYSKNLNENCTQYYITLCNLSDTKNIYTEDKVILEISPGENLERLKEKIENYFIFR